MNNRYLGMVRQWQNFSRKSILKVIVTRCRFCKLYFGIKGLRVDHPDELNATIEEMIDYRGPVLADICVDKAENVFL